MQKLKITDSNVLDCEAVLQSLKLSLEELARMTTRYPVICEFCGIREVFRSRQDIEATIAILDKRITDYHAHAA